MPSHPPVIAAFQRAARDVPAYRKILAEHGLDPADVRTVQDFVTKAPLLDKAGTFGHFPLADLCSGGSIGTPASVLTSSGHSGQFAFGLYHTTRAEDESQWIDDGLDALFAVRSRKTLLVNCLPMGVKVPTRQCTLAETSVRADMVTALVKAFAADYEQMILVGETAFVKHVLELGIAQGIDWRPPTVHVVVGEEPMANNARAYIEGLLDIDPADPRRGLIVSSMGVAELGLNLFSETPALVAVRRSLHRDAALRSTVLGSAEAAVPMVFTYDPRRIFVEVLDDGRLVVSTLDTERAVPLLRYLTGDHAGTVADRDALIRAAEAGGASTDALSDLPVILMSGRGKFATSAGVPVTAEQVKEGLYLESDLARRTTANFRLISGPGAARVRIQLVPGAESDPELARGFREAIGRYTAARLDVVCETYEQFGSGMALDYERKFAYLDANG